MNKNYKITEKNFIVYASMHYKNPECLDENEIHEDLNHITYIKKIFKRYLKNPDQDNKTLRLALNHIILITNVFGPKKGAEILFFKLDKELHSILKTFLVHLYSLPEKVYEINTVDIELDTELIKRLREI